MSEAEYGMNIEPAPKQDLHIIQAVPPQDRWRARPMNIVASRERLEKAHSVCSITNTSPNQVHIIIDRHMQPVEFKPGQRRDGIEMLDEEIDGFRRQREPNRFDLVAGAPYPPHPILFNDVRPVNDYDREAAAVRAAQATVEARAVTKR